MLLFECLSHKSLGAYQFVGKLRSMWYLEGAVGFLLCAHMSTKWNKRLVLSQTSQSQSWLCFRILNEKGEKIAEGMKFFRSS